MGTSRRLMSATGTGIEGAWDASLIYYDDPRAWDLNQVRYIDDVDLSADDNSPQAMYIRPDGFRLYIVWAGSDVVIEYNLSSPWDITPTSLPVRTFSIAAQETNPTGLFFKPDGTKMYICGTTGDDVNEYDLGTAWDVSTAVFLQNFSVAAQDTGPADLFFKPDGTKMYVVGGTGDDVNEYDLGTAWDVSTAVFLQNFSVAAEETLPTGVHFKPDGTSMYVCGLTGDDVNQYDLSTPWDISTATYQTSFSFTAQATNPSGIFFQPDGQKLFMISSTAERLYQYFIGGAELDASTLFHGSIYTRVDGQKLYAVRQDDVVVEYNLSSAWDTTTLSYVQGFSVQAQDTLPTGLFFKPDGTKMYVVGASGDDVNEYDLGTAWDVSTAVFLQNFSVAAQTSNPQEVFFKPDGTKMYVTSSLNTLFQYDLGTAWDVSTASYVQARSIGGSNFSFKPDGTRIFSTSGSRFVVQYVLSVPWDISTATSDGTSDPLAFNTSSGLSVREDGTLLFLLVDDSLVVTYSIGNQP